ncbi:pyruvate kinase [Prosthecomicrobium sp. N25]|uniref:pyruvate kinase n=1 Tax=Prosthecomicrobium sp. N25 TaxID=3129254 RepID=UPI0030784309
MLRNRRAKIVATLGPASSDPQTIEKLFRAGVDVFRLNFSHGSHDDHRRRYESIRALEQEAKHPIAILQDLQGPKIRLGTLPDGKVRLEAGARVTFVLDKASADPTRLPLPHKEVFDGIMPGHKLLIDDGKVRLVARGCGHDFIEATVATGGVISDRKGVNLPDTLLQLSPITEKDRADLAFGLKLGVDWVAFSFVQRAADLMEAHQLIGGRAGVMAKIEKPKALADIDDILRLADAVMVARGDLGVEIPPEEVPGAQKDLVRLCRLAGKPVIIATQMLESMIQAPAPTRAEASDVATAIYDGADAVMLSAESASGQYPLEAVETMDRIVSRTERHSAYPAIVEALHPAVEPLAQHAVSAAAAEVAKTIGAAGIVAFTSTGTTAARIARQRPGLPILAITPNLPTARRLALLWGAFNVRSDDVSSYSQMVEEAVRHVRETGFAQPGECVVVVAGVPFGAAGSTNNLRVVTV